jgi:DNA-binding NarL/FixJ family response regulator
MINALRCKILLADDHLLFSNGLKLLLEQQTDLVVCGQVSTAGQVSEAVHRLSPHLVVLDVNLNGANGIDLGKQLRSDFQSINVLMLTMYNQSRLLDEARKAGLQGYLLKDTDPAELIDSIRLILNGGTAFDARVQLPDQATDDAFEDDFARRLNLTFREVEIIRLIRDGLTSEQIADRLHISFFTVKSHRKNVHTKLGLSNVADLVRFANKNGL